MSQMMVMIASSPTGRNECHKCVLAVVVHSSLGVEVMLFD